MRISGLYPGYHRDLVEVFVENTSLLSAELLRLKVSDHSGTINILVTDPSLLSLFSKAASDYKISLSHFEVSKDYTKLKAYIPKFLTGSEVATHGSHSPWFIWVSPDTVPTLRISVGHTSLDLDHSVSESQITSLCTTKQDNPSQVLRVLGPNNDRYTSLDYIQQHLVSAEALASCYALVVDSTGPYKKNNAPDFMSALKITDASIFPSFATVVIFHKAKEEMVKVGTLGDVIRLNSFTFKIYNGSLSAQRPSTVKHSQLYLFSLEEGDFPYAYFKNQFSLDSEHHHLLGSLRSWGKRILGEVVPDCLKATTRLGDASGECDIVGKVYDICRMGGPLDPNVLIVYDQSAITQLMVPYERRKALRYVQPGMTVRLRSVLAENKRLFMTFYTDLLVVPEFMNFLQVPSQCDRIDELRKLTHIYKQDQEILVGSTTDISDKMARTLGFYSAKNIGAEEICKIEGHLLKVLPIEPSAMYCVSCKKTCGLLLICNCGTETEPINDIELLIWEGFEKEVIKAWVPENECVAFLNGVEWTHLRNKYCSPMVRLKIGLVKRDRLEVTGTKLRKI